MAYSRFPQVRLTLPNGPSDHLDLSAGVEFYLDGDTAIRVALLQRPVQGDWVVRVASVNGTEISVVPGENKDFVAGGVKQGRAGLDT
mgnify:CR=1 FL=1